MVIRQEVLDAFSSSTCDVFLRRVCEMVRTEFEEFRSVPEQELVELLGRYLREAQQGGIKGECLCAEFLTLCCCAAAKRGNPEVPKWWSAVAADPGLDEAGKVAQFRMRSAGEHVR